MILQSDIFEAAPKVIERGDAAAFNLSNTTALVASLSGGIDGFAALLGALDALVAAGVNITTIPVVLWHACLPQMDWVDETTGKDYTDETLVAQLRCIRQHYAPHATLSSWQTVYALTGGETKTGFPSAELQQLHCVRENDVYYGCLESDDPVLMPDLLSLTDTYRKGNPPTAGMRYCTKFTKTAGFDHWLRRHKDLLGPCPLVVRGERRAESHERAKRLEEWSWALGTKQWDAAVWLPCIDWAFHETVQRVYDAGGRDVLHPCYFWQSPLDDDTETLITMLDPTRDERGRPRCSCVLCIFVNLKHIRNAQRKVPHLVNPHLERIEAFETKWQKTWKQAGPIRIAVLSAEER